MDVNKVHEESLKWHERPMLKIARWVGSSLFVVFCILLAFTPLVFPSTLAMVQFISSAFLQLILLPIILIASNLQSRHDQIRADNDFAVNMKAEQEIESLHIKLDTLLEKVGNQTLNK